MRLHLDVTDLLEFLCTAPVLHGVQNVAHQLLLQARERPRARAFGLHPLYGQVFSLALEGVPAETLADVTRLRAFFGLDGRHPVKSRSAIQHRHPDRKLRRAYEELKRVVRRELRALHPPPALALHRDVGALDFSAGDVVLMPGLNVWYPDFARDAGTQAHARGARVALVLYDFGPVTAAEFFPASYQAAFRAWMKNALPQADLFVSISQHTSRELLTLAPALHAAHPPVVTPLGHEFPQAGSAALRREVQEICAQDYVLHVGRIEPRKNIVGLLQVWARLRDLGAALPLLVLAGRMNVPGDEFAAALAGAGRVRLVSDLSTAELARLYENCRFAVYPSFYEGFGLPVGEAAGFGKITAASNAAAIPEVLGDLAVYFDPRDHDEMAAVLRRLITDRDFLAGLETRLAREFRPRRWSDCARDMLAAAERLGK